MQDSSNGGVGATPATQQAQEKVQEVASQAQEQIQQAGGQAKDRVRGEVDSRSSQVGGQVRSAASDLRDIAEELRKKDKETPAKFAETVADRAERVGGYLSDSDADRILSDLESFGRRQPWVVMAGGLALGFLASRVLKASSEQRYRSLSSGPSSSVRRDPATYPAPQAPAPAGTYGTTARTEELATSEVAPQGVA